MPTFERDAYQRPDRWTTRPVAIVPDMDIDDTFCRNDRCIKVVYDNPSIIINDDEDIYPRGASVRLFF